MLTCVSLLQIKNNEVSAMKYCLAFIICVFVFTFVGCQVKDPVEVDDNPVNEQTRFALRFNGTTDHIVIKNIPKSIGVNSTTSAWIYRTEEASNQQWIAGMGARQNLVVRSDGRVALMNYLAKGRSDSYLDPAYWCHLSDPEKVPLNRWVHYAGVIETNGTSTQFKLYRDGVLVNMQEFEYAVNGNPGCDGFIGGVHTEGNEGIECEFSTPQRFVGMIDEVAIWKRSLTQTEVIDVMQRRLNCEDVDLVGYWPFEEGAGLLSIDRSKYTNYASLKYGATWVELISQGL